MSGRGRGRGNGRGRSHLLLRGHDSVSSGGTSSMPQEHTMNDTSGSTHGDQHENSHRTESSAGKFC